ncbi:2-dehydropantoate 2-reductase [Aliishimia ponticola]|uniref:2-dehydropantoate 2-reductase n=1 Tax=Aliishimia ponticola TaxID=2499833 RepID=A0A4S4NEX2_9RHOB|nr:2-dehydropantoate 2-reductase [Aliishimia ponticola]THH34620.1 2-dehydropantoate 2-reductase [Aliishimia ponticola]
MRIIIHGVGAVGGVLAAALSRSGQQVVGIARGAQLEAIRADGLTVRTPQETFSARFDCVAHPSEITFEADDLILLTMKSQDTVAALEDLRAAGVRDQHIFCFQNGVANEPTALRRFPNVHGVTVMMPCSYLKPGQVSVRAQPRFGLFDIGRYPHGADDADRSLAAALDAAGFAGFPMEDVMQSKYGKLLMNLGNIIEASVGPGVDTAPLRQRVRSEAETVLQAAGISWVDVGAADPRRDAILKVAEVPGEARPGGSTVQSLRRGTGHVETDYLNGEIAYLGRRHDVEAPLNARLTQLGADLVRQGHSPGDLSVEDLTALLDGT